MYTGTLIIDLMAVANRVGKQIEQQRIDQELHEIFTMSIPVEDGERTFMGAA